jgi:hypothetical protein
MKQLLYMLERPGNNWVTLYKSQCDDAEALVKKGWLKRDELGGDMYSLALNNTERGLVQALLQTGSCLITEEAYMPAVSHLIGLGIIEPSTMTKGAYELTYDTLELLDALEPIVPALEGIGAILSERQTTYGDFSTQAELSQALKGVVKDAYNARHEDDRRLEDYQCEALEMILHKIARIINGDPSYVDSWTDISGYATLVVKELEKQK